MCQVLSKCILQSVMPIKKTEISAHLEFLKPISQEFQLHHEFRSWPSSYKRTCRVQRFWVATTVEGHFVYSQVRIYKDTLRAATLRSKVCVFSSWSFWHFLMGITDCRADLVCDRDMTHVCDRDMTHVCDRDMTHVCDNITDCRADLLIYVGQE
jgi:hypothetical protein